MRLTRPWPLLLLALLPLAGCDDDPTEPAGITMQAFAGAWTSNSINYKETGGNRSFDLASVGGNLAMAITATTQQAGTFTGTFTLPTAGGLQPLPIKGTITLQGENEAVVDFDWSGTPFAAQPPIADFTATFAFVNDNQFTFTNPTTQFDFDRNGTAEAASVVITMVRATT